MMHVAVRYLINDKKAIKSIKYLSESTLARQQINVYILMCISLISSRFSRPIVHLESPYLGGKFNQVERPGGRSYEDR